MRSALTTHTELNDFDEAELVARAQNGDTEAFNPLVYKYQQKIYNLIYRKVRDRETAKDLCQEVFLKAWQALPNFKGQCVFYSWLYQIAVNRSIDFLRKRNRQHIIGFRGITSERRRYTSNGRGATFALYTSRKARTRTHHP